MFIIITNQFYNNNIYSENQKHVFYANIYNNRDTFYGIISSQHAYIKYSILCGKKNIDIVELFIFCCIIITLLFIIIIHNPLLIINNILIIIIKEIGQEK